MYEKQRLLDSKKKTIIVVKETKPSDSKTDDDFVNSIAKAPDIEKPINQAIQIGKIDNVHKQTGNHLLLLQFKPSFLRFQFLRNAKALGTAASFSSQIS